MATIQLKDGYDRRKEPRTLTFRTLTPEEVKRDGAGHTALWIESADGKAFRVRVNGSAKTWKRRPDVELPIVFGLYSYGRAVSRGDEMVLPYGGRLLVLVSEG